MAFHGIDHTNAQKEPFGWVFLEGGRKHDEKNMVLTVPEKSSEQNGNGLPMSARSGSHERIKFGAPKRQGTWTRKGLSRIRRRYIWCAEHRKRTQDRLGTSKQQINWRNIPNLGSRKYRCTLRVKLTTKLLRYERTGAELCNRKQRNGTAHRLARKTIPTRILNGREYRKGCKYSNVKKPNWKGM